jgi:Mn2+/Fe2+ NRAMP family transporter
MVSAAGSGELLFTPRVGAQYGYALVWALLLAVALKWVVNREVGRYTVVTGQAFLEGAMQVRGPRGWAVIALAGPQLVVAVATIAGLAGAAGTALVLALPGDIRLWTVGSILAATVLVAAGRYGWVERSATVLALLLGGAAVAAALSVGPDAGALAEGARPQLPDDLDLIEVIPWLGFLLSGAAGIMWYSYWLEAKGYGAAGRDEEAPEELSDQDRSRLRGWLTQMTLDNTVAVIGTLILTFAFLILGTELLRPEGMVPAENEVADVLGRLLGDVWGRAGYWFMIAAVFVGFWDTVLSDQDGFARMFTHAARLLAGSSSWLPSPDRLRLLLVLGPLAAAPIVLYLIVGEPVGLLKLAGVIEALHLPVVAGMAVVLGRRLPEDLRPSRRTVAATITAALFFAAFAATYLFQIVFGGD